MFKTNPVKLLGLVMVLAALLAGTGSWVASQAAGGGSGIQATVYNDAVRFAVQNEKVAVLRAEVFNLSGKLLYDSGPVMGKALDWNMSTEARERVARELTAWPELGQGSIIDQEV